MTNRSAFQHLVDFARVTGVLFGSAGSACVGNKLVTVNNYPRQNLQFGSAINAQRLRVSLLAAGQRGEG